MTIFGCDIDGVVADIGPELHRRISLHFNVPVEAVKKDSYYMHDRFNIDPKTMSKFIENECFSDDSFWYDCLPIQHNIDALKRMGLDHRLIFITGRHAPCRDVTERWLVDQGLNYHTVLMHSLSVKHRALKHCGAEFMIEDRHSEAVTIAQKGFRSYLVRTPYNMDYAHQENPEKLIFVNTVEEVMEAEKIYG